MFDRIASELKCDKVIVDDFDSAVNATQYLIDTNCKKIALFSTINNLSVGELRENGYKEALRKNKIKLDESLALLSDSDEGFDEKMGKLILEKKPDAIFAIDEYAVVTAMKFCLKNGLNVPDDISIIGFADGLWSRRMTPSLSTISQHAPEIGQKTSELIIKRIEEVSDSESQKVFETVVIKTELRKRDSVRKLS